MLPVVHQCYICLSYNHNLCNVFNDDDNWPEVGNGLKGIAPDINFLEYKPFFVCHTCCTNIIALSNFKSMLYKNILQVRQPYPVYNHSNQLLTNELKDEIGENYKDVVIETPTIQLNETKIEENFINNEKSSYIDDFKMEFGMNGADIQVQDDLIGNDTDCKIEEAKNMDIMSISSAQYDFNNFKLSRNANQVQTIVDVIDLCQSDEDEQTPSPYELTTLQPATPTPELLKLLTQNIPTFQFEPQEVYQVLPHHFVPLNQQQTTQQIYEQHQQELRQQTLKEINEELTIKQEQLSQQTVKLLKNQGKKPKTYSCNECHTKFSRKQAFDAHINFHAEKKSFTCAICDGFYPSWQLFVAHSKEHSPYDYICGICNEGFVNRRDITFHKRKHPYNIKFICPLCSKVFHTSFEIYRHRLKFECIVKKK